MFSLNPFFLIVYEVRKRNKCIKIRDAQKLLQASFWVKQFSKNVFKRLFKTICYRKNLFDVSSKHCVKSVQTRSFFWSVFSLIWTEYGEIWSISRYSVQMRENTDQKKLRIWTHFTQWSCIKQETFTWQKVQETFTHLFKVPWMTT